MFHRFFEMLDRFLEVLGWFWKGLGSGFSTIFHIIIENHDFEKNSVLPRKKHYFQGFNILKTNAFSEDTNLGFYRPCRCFLRFFQNRHLRCTYEKIRKTTPQNLPHTFPKAAKFDENSFKKASKRDFERRWDIKAQKIDKKTKTTPPGLHFGRIWEALGCHLDVLGRLLDAPWASLERSWTSLGHLLGLLGTS